MLTTSELLDLIKKESFSTPQPLHYDADLAKGLGIRSSSLSHLRSGRMKLGPTLIIRIHELTGWSIRDIKGRLGLPSLHALDLPQNVVD